jgi:hypothetical protein
MYIMLVESFKYVWECTAAYYDQIDFMQLRNDEVG